MKLDLLTAMLRIYCGLWQAEKICKDYDIPTNVVKQIGSKESYVSETGNDSDADKYGCSSEKELF